MNEDAVRSALNLMKAGERGKQTGPPHRDYQNTIYRCVYPFTDSDRVHALYCSCSG